MKLTLSQAFFVFCVSVLVGVALANLISVPVWSVLLFTPIFTIGYIFSKSPQLLFLLFVVCGVALGLLRAESVSTEDMLRYWVDKEVYVGGSVSSVPNIATTYSSFVLKIDSVNGEKIAGEIFVLLSRDSADVNFKDNIVLDCVIEKSNRDDGYICAFPGVVEHTEHHLVGLELYLKKAYEGFVQTLTLVYAQPAAGFITGILVGGTAQFNDELVEQFRLTGTLHLVALSGFNISIIVGFVMIVYERVGVPRRWYSISIAGLLIVFVMFVGAQASIVRAAIMGYLVVLARQRGRYTTPRNILAATATVMVLISPHILLDDIGFQLSFLATIGIVYLSPLLEKWTTRIPNLFQLKEALLLSISAEIMVLPLLVWYFGHLSVVSPVTNMLVGPLIPFAMLFGFLGGVVGLISVPLGQMVGLIGWVVATLVLKIIELFALLPFAYAPLTLPFVVIIIYYVVVYLIYKSVSNVAEVFAHQPWRAR